MTVIVEMELVTQLPADTPVGSILEEIKADPDGIEEVKRDWQSKIGALGTVKNVDITEAGVVEI